MSDEQTQSAWFWARCSLLTAHCSSLALLEQSSDRKVHTALAGRTYTPSQRDGSHNRVCDYSYIERAAHNHRSAVVELGPECRARFIPSTPVDLLPHQLRQAVHV